MGGTEKREPQNVFVQEQGKRQKSASRGTPPPPRPPHPRGNVSARELACGQQTNQGENKAKSGLRPHSLQRTRGLQSCCVCKYFFLSGVF